MQQRRQVSVSPPNYDPFTQSIGRITASREILKTKETFTAAMKEDATFLFDFIFDTASRWAETEPVPKSKLYAYGIRNVPSDELVESLGRPRGRRRTQKDLKIYAGRKGTKKAPRQRNPKAAAVEVEFNELLENCYNKIKNAPGDNSDLCYWVIKKLTLADQIGALTNTEKRSSPTPELTAWKECLAQLCQDAGYDRDKRAEVRRYVKATQALLRDGENLKATQAFQSVLDELSKKAERVDLYREVVHVGVAFLVAITVGALIVATATILPALLFVFVAAGALVIGNFYKSETPEGRVSEGISYVFDKMGFFKSRETHKAAQNFRYPKPANEQSNNLVAEPQASDARACISGRK